MKINLSIVDIHKLLNELEHLMRFNNIDISDAEYLYEKITDQLKSENITIEGY